MSAYMVGSTHIDALLTAGLHRAYATHGSPVYWRWGNPTRDSQLTRETADRVGAMLLAANQDSVNHRYGDEEIEEVYTYRRMEGYPHPLVILRALSCYDYQACEPPGWETSEAYAFVEALRYRAISILTRDVDTWEIGDRDHFLKFSQLTAVS